MENTRRGLDLLCTLSNMLWNSADRTPRKYRLTNTAGMWRIRRPEIYNGLGKYEIWKTGTIYPRCVDSYHKVFCDLYRLDRRCAE